MTDSLDFAAAYAHAADQVLAGTPSDDDLDIWAMAFAPTWTGSDDLRVSDCGRYVIREDFAARTYAVTADAVPLATVDFLDAAERVALRHKALAEQARLRA